MILINEEKFSQLEAKKQGELFKLGYQILISMKGVSNDKEKFLVGNTGNNAGIRNDGYWVQQWLNR